MAATVRLAAGATNLLVNSEFNAGTSGWGTVETVFTTGENAILSDQGGTRVVVFQSVEVPVAATAGLTLSFDFLNALSPVVALGQTPDSIFGTVYTGVQPFGSLYDSGDYDVATGLVDADYRGSVNFPAGMTLGPSPKGAGWVRHTVPVPVVPFVTVAFEFIEGNDTPGDSSAAFDNIFLFADPIPEPSAAGLVLTAGLLVWRRRRAEPERRAGPDRRGGATRSRSAGLAAVALAAMGMLGGETRAQDTGPPLLEPSRARASAKAERSTLDRKTGVLTSTVDLEVVNTGTQRIDGPVHALIRFRDTSTGAETLSGVTVVGALGGVGRPPHQVPFFDLSPQAAGGWDPAESIGFTLVFSRARTLNVTYEVSLAGFVNTPPTLDPGGPYAGRVGEPVSFAATASDPDGDPVTVTWEFGDGTTATGNEVSHSFAAAGVKAVKVTADDGRSGVVEREVTALISPSGNFALAHTRVVTSLGHPLGTATVQETGPDGTRDRSVADSGFVSLGSTAGEYVWMFSAPGHQPVWRAATLLDGAVRLIPSPWLAPDGPSVSVSVLEATVMDTGSGGGTARLTFPAGAFSQPGSARLTPLGPQSLPFPLPFGWSPLAAFHLALPESPIAPGSADLTLLDALGPGEFLTLVRFEPETRVWRTVQSATASDPAQPTRVFFPITEPGAYAAVVRDEGTDAPIPVADGNPLPAGVPQELSTRVAAVGIVDPPQRAASLDPAAVTSQAQAVFTPATGVLPSGSWFRIGVQETYDLTDGAALRTPDYDATVYAYRRPPSTVAPAESVASSRSPGAPAPKLTAATTGEGRPVAVFPLRPQILFGPADLAEARLHIEVRPPLGDGAAALSTDGGALESEDIRLTVPANAVQGFAAGSLRALDPTAFASLAGPGQSIVRAFELNLTGLLDGSQLALTLGTPLPPNTAFTLARLTRFANGSGLTPVQRLTTNPSGQLENAEPPTPPRLPGLTGAGQYLLVQLPAPQGLVTGIVVHPDTSPAPGIGVRLATQPWLDITNTTGRFALLAPAGPATTLATHPTNGDGATATVDMPASLPPQNITLTLGALPPRLVTSSPPDGGTKVSPVTPITLEFSEKLAPSSLGANPITLRAEGATEDLLGSATLDLSGRFLTFLPTAPLAAGLTHSLTLNPDLRDLQGLALDGPRTLTFTTTPPAARGLGAQLTIYEPGATGPTPADQALLDAIPGYSPGPNSSHVAAIGSPGTADPEVPVILVNESTGATATVLSKPDGSFANFIDAEESDFISATFINSNSTRITLPASKQKFDDGRVGLFAQGGILEAENQQPNAPEAPIEIMVEPGSIASRTVFRISSASPAELQQLLANNPPETGNIAGAFRYEITSGEPPAISPVVMFPATRAQLGLTADDDPANHTFALCQTDAQNGISYYNIIDRMKYEDGKLITSSPPFLGLSSASISGILMVPVRMAFGFKFTVAGRVLAARSSDLPQGGLISEEEAQNLQLNDGGPLVPVPGALVFGSTGGNNDISGRLRPGAFACKSNRRGFYATLVPYNPITPDPILLSSTHPSLVNITARGVLLPDPQESVALPVSIKHLVFSLPDGIPGDFAPPNILTLPGPAFHAVGEPVTLLVQLEDGQSKPTLLRAEFDPSQSLADNETTILTPTSVQVTQEQVRVTGPRSVEIELRIRAFEALRAGFLLSAADEAGNEITRLVTLRFGTPAPVNEELELVDDGDTTPPTLTHSIPGAGIPLNGDSLALTFSEPLSRTAEDPSAVTATGASIVRRRLSTDQKTLFLTLGNRTTPVRLDAQPTSPTFISFSLSQALLKDLAGNPLLGDDMLSFPVLSEEALSLNQTSSAVAVTMAGTCVATLRNFGQDGQIVLHDSHAAGGAEPVGSLSVPPFPRAMVYLPDVTYFLPDPSPPPFTTLPPNQPALSLSGSTKTSDLIAVTGGLTGEDQVGPWLWLIDISDPTQPRRLASSLVTADFTTAASILKWSTPNLLVGIFSTEGSQILSINLQALIIGSQGFTRTEYAFGLDLNLDGDYVDQGERAPVPKRQSLFGLEEVVIAPDKTSFNDFAARSGGSLLLAVSREISNFPARLHVLRTRDAIINPGEGTLDLPSGTYRILFDPLFPLEDESGTQPVPAALLTAGNQLLVVSLADPKNPRLVRQHQVASNGATIFSLTEVNRSELVVTGNDGTHTLSRTLLGRLGDSFPVSVNIPELAIAGGRSVGASDLALTSFSAAGTRILYRRPEVGVIRFPAQEVKAIDEILALPEDDRRRLFSQATESSFLVPAFFEDQDLAPLSPPDPELHHYVLLKASGHFGQNLRVGVQSMGSNEGGSDTLPCGPIAPLNDLEPNLLFLDAKRLSADSKSPLFNQFLAGPFVIVRHPLTEDQSEEIPRISGRHALWGGDQVRAFIAANATAPASFLVYAATQEDPPILPRVSTTYRSFRPEYQDSRNPSGRMAPRLLGGLLDLQSGEISMSETDAAAEGRHQDLVFRRTYQSQSVYSGVLGPNWDHNFNARIHEFAESDFPPTFRATIARVLQSAAAEPSADNATVSVPAHELKEIIARPGDVNLIDGAGATQLFRRIAPENENEDLLPQYASDPALAEFWGLNPQDKIRNFYESPEGIFTILVQLNDLKWVLIGTGGNRIYFNANGTLDRLVGARPSSVLTCHYRPKDGLLGEVRGDNGSRLRLGYYYPFLDARRTGPIDTPSDDPVRCGRLAKVEAQLFPGPGGQKVSFEYDEQGLLKTATPSWRRPITYGYDQEDPRLVTRFGEADSTGYPSATISYISGVVKTITTGGETLSTTGSVPTAAERFATGPTILTFGPSDNPAQISVNERGQPTSVGNRSLGADAEGQLTRFQTLNEDVALLYDADNPVRRFQGNLIRTEKRPLQEGPARVTHNQFDGGPFNRPTRATDANGVITEYGFPPGQMTTVRGGLITTQTLLNAFGQRTSESVLGGPVPLQTQFHLEPVSELPGGASASTTFRFTRDDVGRVRQDQQGLTGSIHNYHPQSGQPESLDPLDAAVQPRLNWTYDEDGRIHDETLTGGDLFIRHNYVYSEAHPGQPERIIITENSLPPSVTENSFDTAGRLIRSVVDGIPAVMSYEGPILVSFDSPDMRRELTLGENAQIETLEENGVLTSFTYDEAGRVSSVEVAGTVTHLEYDDPDAEHAADRLASRTIEDADDPQAQSVSESYGYDAAGRLERITSSNGRERRFEFHGDGRVSRALINGTTVRQLDLSSDGSVTAVTLGNLRRSPSSFQPGHGRPGAETLAFTDSGASMSVFYTYDSAGRPLLVKYPNGSYATTYDAFGHITTSTDPDLVHTQYAWSASGVPLTCTLSDGSTIQYSVGPGRRRERTTSAAGNEEFIYSDNQLREVRHPDGTLTQFDGYNEFLSPESVTRGSVQQILEYDDRGRPVAISSETEDTSWSCSYDAFGRRVSSSLGDEETQFVYNEFDALAGEVVVSNGEEIGEWSVERDVLDRTVREEYPSGMTIDYTPDTFGQPTAMRQSGIQSITWHGLGLPSEARFLSGLVVKWTYDASFRNHKIEYISGSGAISGFSYTLSPGGRVLSETRLHERRRDEYERLEPAGAMRIKSFDFGIPTNPAPGEIARPQAFVRQFSFANGELLSPLDSSTAGPNTGDDRGFFPSIVRQNGSNRLAIIDGTPVTHNDRGSMESFPVWIRLPNNRALVRTIATVTWDGLGNMIRLTRDDGVTVDYTRDGEGRIVLREVTGPTDRCNASSTRYFWAGRRLLEERDASNAELPLLRRYHYLGGKFVLMEAAKPDGSLQQLVPLVSLNGSVGGYLDEAGALLHTIQYGPYGLPVEPSADEQMAPQALLSPLRFQGAFFDDATGLYEFGERHLHPLTGGFLEIDSKLFRENLAWFTAFNGDPAGRLDPFGRSSDAIETIQTFQDQAEKAKGLYEPAKGLIKGEYGEDDDKKKGLEARANASIDLATAGIDLWLTNQDDDTREQWGYVTDTLGQMKEGIGLFYKYREAFKTPGSKTDAEEETEPTSIYAEKFGWLSDNSEMLLFPDLSKSLMDSERAEFAGFADVTMARSGLGKAPEFEDSYKAAFKDRMESYGRAKTLLTLGRKALQVLGPEALGDEHKTQIADQFLAMLESGVSLAEVATRLRGDRALVALRENPIAALQSAFDFGFEVGKTGIIALSDPSTAKEYADLVKQYEEDGGWLTVGSGVLASFGADDTAHLIQSIADTEIDVVGSFQTVFQNALAERERRQNLTEYYLRNLRAP